MKAWVLTCVLVLHSAAAAAADLKVVADFPGGSARVEGIDQAARVVRVQPYPHADRGWVCWWYFKVEGIEPGETVTIELAGGAFALGDRAFLSFDNRDWKQTEPGQRGKERITYKVRIDAKEAWFAWGPPYLLKHAEEAVRAAAKKSPHATAFELCKSKEGKPVPALRIAQPGAKDEERLGIWINARQHAWESGGSWVCQGLIDWLVSADPAAEALRKKATIILIPIMDVDNVERGAGGKNQKPHDHNRDWSDQPVWNEVQAAIKQITELNKAGRLDMFLDLHNPGPGDRQPFFFVPAAELLQPQSRRNLDSFLAAARKEITGPLKLADKPKETGPAYDPNWQKISGNWVAKNARDHVVGCCLETAWNTPQSTAENYKTVGKQLGQAIERYFREPTRPK